MNLLNRYRSGQLAVDALLIAFAWWAAFQLRFERLPVYYDGYVEPWIFVAVVAVKVVVLAAFGLYSHWWRYVSIRDMWSLLRATLVGALVAAVLLLLWDPLVVRLPRGIFLIDGMLVFALLAGARVLTRTLFERPGRWGIVARGKEVLIVGAGDAGSLIIREMRRSPRLSYTPVGLVDDDSRKRNLRLDGVRVLGATDELPRILQDVDPDEVIIAIPSAAGEARQSIVNSCRNAGVPVKTLPTVNELITGGGQLASQLREVQVEDVLGRAPVDLDLASIASYIGDETVLVTGAGGSIGAELCRQLVTLGPRRIILLDHAENNLFEIDRELVHEREFTAVVPVLADVKNRSKLRQVFEDHQPGVVFHAAAYKHVPLIEANPLEAIRNNVLATRVAAEVAQEAGTRAFVLVSTDKAVDARNVLGQSKALCEWVMSAAAARSDNTRFLAVRFGNVLASSGSVIPLFRRQISRGGPVTVTHPDMTRYFMTIPEAAQLIIQAGALGSGGEVFVLDMGEPVKIVDLARNMIRLSGREPGVDIAIEYMGVRPGEKLHESLWANGESPVNTTHPKIQRCVGTQVDETWLTDELDELERLMDLGETVEVVGRLNAILDAPVPARRQDTTAGAPASPTGPAARA
jgi:FlaA1/EpsC-like NDP-sugar epimerase